MTDAPARLSAALIGMLALAAMGPPLGYALADTGGSLIPAIWHMLRAFTIMTNLIVGVTFLWIAFRGRDAVPPLLTGGAMLAILLVGIIFNLLLGGMQFETVWAMLGDRIHHMLIPVAVPLWWLAFARKGTLGWSAPLIWMAYPLAYSAHLIVRAQALPAGTPGRYVYFFMDADMLGWPMVAANMAGIAIGFALVGFLVLAIDHRLARRGGSAKISQ